MAPQRGQARRWTTVIEYTFRQSACSPSSTAPCCRRPSLVSTIEAPRIAQIRQPGQFVIVRRGPGAERIPLTIADGDAAAGTITLVIQAVGKSTSDLVELQVGERHHRRRRTRSAGRPS